MARRAATQDRKVIGKDHYGNPGYEGQVEGKDAHGNRVYLDAPTGPAHHRDKHMNRKGSVNTGRKDAHGNEIWENQEDNGEAAAAASDE